MPAIEKRGNRSYRLIVEGTPGPDGRTQEKKTIRVPEELLKAPQKLDNYLNKELVKFQIEVESGEYVKPDLTTFAAFTEKWKTNYADVNLGGNTKKNYYAIIKTHLNPEFGHMKLNTIRTMHIVSYLSKLRAPESRKDKRNKPLSTNTILNVYRVLKSILDAAAKWRVIARNPMEGVDRPVAGKKERRELKQQKKFYSSDEAKQVILALCEEPEHWKLYFLGVMMGGFRRGEMLGVEWPQVDFKTGGLWIIKQITFDEYRNVIEGEVKTDDSEAFVPMPKWFMEELRSYKNRWEEKRGTLREGSKWTGDKKEFLFHDGYGTHLYPDAPTLKWRRLRQKHNLPHVRLHGLRHTAAMLLREEQVDLKTIQERLRHSRLETTSNIYTHKSEIVSRLAADKLEKFNPALQSEQADNSGTNGEHNDD